MDDVSEGPMVKRIKHTQLAAYHFECIGMKMVARDSLGGSATIKERRFRSAFGVSAVIVSQLWNTLAPYDTMPQKGITPSHLLWALLFLKDYGKETTLCDIAGGLMRRPSANGCGSSLS